MISISSRSPIKADIPKILEIYGQNNSPNSAFFRNIIKDIVIEHNDSVVAFGVVKMFAEACIALDNTQGKKINVKSLQTMFNTIIPELRKSGILFLHAFTDNPGYADILVKHFGFKKREEIPLYLEL